MLETVQRAVIPQVVAAVKRLGKADEDARAIAQRIVDALDLSAFDDLPPEAETILATMVRDGVAEGLAQLDITAGVDVAQVSDEAVRYARARAAELVGKRWTADGALVDNPNAEYVITDATREMLRADIAQAIEDGTSTDGLATTLASNYAFSDERADTIARTEIARADVAGNMASYRASGVVIGKQWLLGSEHDDEDECDEAAALGVVDLDDDFGGVGDPPAHPRCGCDVAPVVDDSTSDAEE